MQTSVPDTFAVDDEPQHVLDLYGVGGDTDRFGRACLTARRLVERGVRFIQLTSTGWDHHGNLRQGLTDRFRDIDRPIAGLIADLKQRDLLKETLIVWGGEFGRSSGDDKGDGNGRGHNGQGFTMWMAGGGVKGGFRYGATDEMGSRAVENVMGVHDLHATILHLLGLDHEQLTFHYAGRDFRLTETEGRVAKEILA
jgi:arylsulfatase A-like enzyme